jgi:hypothetical protein
MEAYVTHEVIKLMIKKNIPMGDIPHSLASIEKAKKLIKYSPLFNMISGLEIAVKWYSENLK